ncbi:MAG: cofactor assembly of complex C subunit B [Cyanobacteriota bacterium]|nr:cofactor assembly of complex C subunit B [Cyanobacteriota bacterium]
MAPIGSTLLLTVLMAIGLMFFLRAASKDRTTVVEVQSPRPALEVLDGMVAWLGSRGWKPSSKDPLRQVLRFSGQVQASLPLAVLLSLLGSLGGGSLALVLHQLLPEVGWWVFALALLGPLAGWIYCRRAARPESLELRLIEEAPDGGSTLRLRAHRDELIAMEKDLGPSLGLASDGRLLRSPI